MILIFGRLADKEMAYITLRLLQRGADFTLVDTVTFPHLVDLSYLDAGGVIDGTITYGSQRIALRDVQSIYLRGIGPLSYPSVSPTHTENRNRQAYYESCEMLRTLVDTLPVLIVNRPSAMSSNSSKPYQQQIISTHGFKTPRTLVTTVPEDARRFYEECQGQVIFKSVSYQRSIVKRMSFSDLPRLEQVRYCPTQFQEYVAGVDFRVHTVGDRVFASEVISDAVDYRYPSLDNAERAIREIDLPADIAARCLSLARRFDLVLSGIDLRRTPAGEYYCFEVNTSPGFTFYQENASCPIGDALVDILSNGSATG
jgi:glutathione synthase/RimK-type ligase-like ATP-grasp enzyme